MRRYICDQIIGVLSSVEEGVRHCAAAEGEASRQVQSDCRDALMMIRQVMGDHLTDERAKWYTAKIERFLHNLELLESMTGDAQSKKEAVSFSRKLGFSISMMGKELDNDPEILLEVVFLPYKASMWDSLESVWYAAKDDPRCAVSVVPIPYIERSQDRSQERLCYEGDMFPSHVSVIHYSKYDFESMKPDIAYIHNPYDQYNYVTSVHPDYYSQNLKRNVKNLIYVPYFASDRPAGRGVAQALIHSHADYAIASSEADLQEYMAHPTKVKILPLGSPKIDRILNLEKAKPSIPSGWETIIGKKVFMINSSIGSLLTHSNAYFSKLEAIVRTFERRTDIALIWRPHPLTEATIRSMRPDLWRKFERFKKLVLDSPCAVLDESADMGSAIALSDAYIGDGASSLVHLYALTGKPLFMIEFTLPAMPDERLIDEQRSTDMIFCPYVRGETAWGFSIHTNALYRFDTSSGKGGYIGSVPDEHNFASLYTTPAVVGEKLLLAPGFANEWAVYDMQSAAWEKVELTQQARVTSKDTAKFFFAAEHAGSAIFAPNGAEAFAKYDADAHKIRYYSGWFKSMAPHVIDWRRGLFSQCCCTKDGSLYLASPQGNIVAELNMDTMKVRIHRVGREENRYWGIAYAGGRFWLTKYRVRGEMDCRDGIVSWEPVSGEVTEYESLPCGKDKAHELGGFWWIRPWGDCVLAFPAGGDCIIKIDPANGKMVRFDIDLGFTIGDNKSPYYNRLWHSPAFLFAHSVDKDTIIAGSMYDNSIIVFDAGNETAKKHVLELEGAEDVRKKLERAHMYVYYERALLSAEQFADKVISGEIPAFDEEQATFHRAANANSDGSCGEKIHEYIMERAR